MEALNFLRFWRSIYSTQKDSQIREIQNPVLEFDEEDDSFFDLEVSRLRNSPDEKFEKFSGDEKPTRNELISLLRLSPADQFSKRKILPVEPNSKPQSPIALFKSGPKFRVFAKSAKSEIPKQVTASIPIFSRANSVRKTEGVSAKQKTEELFRDDSSVSKRFSKDVIQKYINRLKPKKQNDRSSFPDNVSISSPASSPAMSCYSPREKQGKNRGGRKNFSKSRSFPVTASPVIRKDDSLLQDGIQSAILHCKNSFNSRDSSSNASDSSMEKLSNASSSDCSMLSRESSASAFEILH